MVTNPLNLEAFLNEYPDIKNRNQTIKLHSHITLENAEH